MQRWIVILAVFAISSGPTSTQAQFGQGGFGGANRANQPPEDARPIQLDIAIINVAAGDEPAKPLNEEQQLARIERLEADGKLAGIQRLKLHLVANQQAQLQAGETVQMLVGRAARFPGGDPNNRGGGFPAQEMTRAQQVGTLVQATARPTDAGAIVEIKLERSGVSVPRPAANAEAAPELPKTNQVTISTTVLLREGKSKIIASAQSSKEGDKPAEEVLVTARVTVGAADTKTVSQLRIFHLQNISAKDAVEVISTVFDQGHLRVVADPRTNVILVASAPEDTLQQVEAVLLKLDEATAAPKVQRLVPIPDTSAPAFVAPPARKTPTARDTLDDLAPGKK